MFDCMKFKVERARFQSLALKALSSVLEFIISSSSFGLAYIWHVKAIRATQFL